MVAEQPTSDGPGGIDAPPPTTGRGNLAPIALGLGIPGLLLGLVPFYGSFLALPLSVVAVVLGLTARGRPEEHRGQATGGLVTGGLGLLLVIGWVGLFAWNQGGLGTFASETSVQVESGSSSAVAVPAPDPAPVPDGTDSDEPVTVSPPGQHGAVRTGLSGEAEGTLGGRDLAMELSDCALSHSGGRSLLVRGDGPDGRLVVTQVGEFSGGVVVAVESADGPSGTWAGTQRGMSGSSGSGGLLTERHRFTLEGQVRDLHDGREVSVELVVTCD